MSIRVEKTVPACGRDVTVRELTVGEIRAWLAAPPSGDVDVVDELLIDEISLADLRRMTDVTAAEIDQMTPGELRELRDACREVNQDFFALRAKLMEAGGQVLAAAKPA